MRKVILIAVVFTLLFFGTVLAKGSTETDGGLTAEQIIERSLFAFYYQGDDMKARVAMELIAKGGGTRTRIMTMLRRDVSEGGDQKYFMYFHEPGDVRRMTFMIWKYVDKEDDRWIFVPAVDLVRRISADDKYSSFVGSDFSYEDISGRALADDTYILLRTEELDGNPVYVVQSIPRDSAPYTKRVSWIDVETFLPLREEYYDAQDEMYRIFTADTIESLTAGEMTYATVTVRTMVNVKTGHRTVVTFESIEYDIGLDDGDFSERYMRQPPRDWIK